jgi:hypothetical protein
MKDVTLPVSREDVTGAASVANALETGALAELVVRSRDPDAARAVARIIIQV